MKRNIMPVTMIMLVFSWLTAILGICIGVYLIIYKLNDIKYLFISIIAMVVSVLLAGMVRMLANIGQMLFEMQASFREENTILNNSFGLLNDTMNGLIKQSFFQTSLLQEIIQHNKVNYEIRDTIIKNLNNLNGINDSIIKKLNEINDSIIKNLNVTNDAIIKSISELKHSLSEDLEILKKEFDSLGCDSKEITQDIFQIKTFFDKIEQHLGLKK